MSPPRGIVDWSFRAAYRLVLFSFPRDFRNRFGPQMVEAFEHYRRGTESPIGGMVRGFRGLFEVAWQGARERLTRVVSWFRPPRQATPRLARQRALGLGAATNRILSDARFALRSFRRTPVFTITALAILTLGIGSSTQLGGGDPIGTIVRWSFRTDFTGRRQLDLIAQRSEGSDEIPMRIVGVVEDVVQTRVAEGPRPSIYVPYTQSRAFSVRAVVRTALPPEAILSELLRVAERFNSGDLLELGTMQDRLASESATLQFQAMLVSAFSLIALLLAAAGVYGSLAHSVGRRQRELGVRMALGANRAGVLRMVFSQGMRLSMTGLAFGMIVTLLSTRVLAGFLYGLEPNDPTTLLMVGAVMVVVSAAACLAPARRATAVDPATVLKAE